MRPASRAFLRAIAALALGAAIFAATAQTPHAPRPRIGLVLGGGGARGGAHLGILEVLEGLRVPIDCIAGTSMGALVGGAYPAGASPPEIEERARKTAWDTMV